MAPEQVETPGRVDHRADIYSLGVVFYEMLSGELPLGKFAPPSRKVQVDVRLDEVVLHALEKDADRRYQHASEIKTDVENIAGSARPSLHASGAAPLQGQPSLLARGPDFAQTKPTTETEGWFIFFFSFFWLLVGLKKDLPVVAAFGVAGVLWGVGRVGLVEWWRNRLGRLRNPDSNVTGKDSGRPSAPPVKGASFALGYSVVGALALVECGLIAAGVVTDTVQWLVVAAASAVVWGVVTMICTAHVLDKRGVRIVYPLLGPLMLFKYLPQYRALTLQETGRVGPLFYSYVVAMNLALVAVALAWVVHAW
jgi:hypothetical protein